MKIHQLYPLKFNEICKEKVWGGDWLNKFLNKNCPPQLPIGETWEISAVQDNLSVVKNGFLSGNTLQDITEIYMTDLVGEQVYFKYGIEFPILTKFIHSNDFLSVQVHPDDNTAKFRHYAYGKTELWYIIHAEPDAELIMGWNQQMDKQKLLTAIEKNNLPDYLNYIKVKPGDVFFIPPGRVHALGKGIIVAEIQQTSDITYRLFDWGRLGLDGKPRDLHIDLALDVIDYNTYDNYKIEYKAQKNITENLITDEHFTVNILEFDRIIERNYMTLDSFVIYIVLDGEFALEYYKKERTLLTKGENVLLPAEFEEVRLLPYKKSKIIEIYIENFNYNIQNTIEAFFGNGQIV